MTRRDERIFNPRRVHKKGRWKVIIPLSLLIVILIGSGVLFYLYKSGNSYADKVFSIFEKESADEDYNFDRNAEATVLLMSVSLEDTIETGGKDIYFMVLAHGDMKDKKIRYCPLEIKDSYLKAYEEGGAREVADEVSREYGIKVDRYISSSENTFANALNYMGGLDMVFSERIEYRTQDLTLIITPGEQNVKGESLVKYMKYLKTTNLKKQGDVLCMMTDTFFTEYHYNKAMNLFVNLHHELNGNTNISYVDTADNLKYIKAICMKNGKKAETVKSVEDLF